MLITQRRAWWGLSIALALVGSMTIRPLRTVWDRCLWRMSLEPRFSIGQLHFHTRDSLLETTDFSFRDVTDSGSVQLCANRGWFRLDTAALPDQRFLCQGLLLEQSRLYLDVTSTELLPVQSSLTWRQKLSEHVSRFDWDKVKQQLRSLLSADDTIEDWETQVESWLEQSQEIVAKSQQLRSSDENDEKVVRFEQELRRRLARIDQLAAEQKVIAAKFEAMRKLLSLETQRLQELHEHDQMRLAEIGQDTSQVNSPEWTEPFADTLLTTIGISAWIRYADYAQVSYLLASGVTRDNRKPYDQDIRPNLAGSDFQVARANTSGVFFHHGTATPFGLTASFTASRSNCETMPAAFRFRYQFHRPGQLVSIDAQRKQRGPASIVITCSETQTDATLVRGIFTCDKAKLDGVLEVTQNAINELEFNDSRLVSRAMADSNRVWIQYGLSGTWERPEIEITGEGAKWLRIALENSLAQQLKQSQLGAQQRCQHEIDVRLARLVEIAEHSSDDFAKISKQQRQQLQSAEDEIYAQLEETANPITVAEQPVLPIKR